MIRRVLVLSLAILAGCGDGNDDLQDFVQNAGQGLQGKIDPLPEVKLYEPFIYSAMELPDPFKPRKLKQAGSGGGAIQPDLNRRKEALESFELEKLKMVGTLEQNGIMHALIKAPDNSLHRVKVGNHLGVNFGSVEAISATEVRVKEIVEDSSGDWSEKENSLVLVEEASPGQTK